MTSATTLSPERPGLSAVALRRVEALVIPLAALIASALIFSVFLLVLGKSPRSSG